jgi:hypothetical protein
MSNREVNYDDVAAQLDKADPIELVMMPELAFAFVAAVQLVSRHPTAGKMLAIQNVAQLARHVQERLGKGRPEVAKLLEQGWHSCYDVPRK